MIAEFPSVTAASDSHIATSVLEDSQQLFDSDRSGCLRVYFLVVEGLTETVSLCPKNYQPQSLDTLFAIIRSAAKIPGYYCTVADVLIQLIDINHVDRFVVVLILTMIYAFTVAKMFAMPCCSSFVFS